MKKLLLVVLLLSCQALPIRAQEDKGKGPVSGDEDIRTLFKKSDKNHKVGFFIGPDLSYTRFRDKDAFLGGLSGGVIIDHFFSVGLAACGIFNSGNLFYKALQDSTGAYLYGGYGGAKLEFRLLPKYPVHINFPVIIGGGGIVFNTWTYRKYDYEGVTIDWDTFFVVEPGVMVEVNLLRFMRAGLGVSYRYAPGLDLKNKDNDMLNTLSGNVSLKFGKF